MKDLIKKDLQNFPNEVIESWLEPYALKFGWPPVFEKWGYIFPYDLNFWRNVNWAMKSLDLTTLTWGDITNGALVGMEKSYLEGVQNAYSGIQDGKLRFQRAWKHFIIHGVFPKRICLLLKDGAYVAVDGNHRLLAFKKHRDLIRTLGIAPIGEADAFKQALKQKFSVEEPADFSPVQEVWVATPADSN